MKKVVWKNGALVEYKINGASKLGNRIARVATPIAAAADTVLGTKIVKCGGCKKMKARLNAGVRFTEALKLRVQGK